jgi:hypothetical protein
MTTSRKTLRTSLAAALLLAGVTTIAQGQTGGGFGSFGGGTRGLIQIKGSVICTGCSLNEVREAQPQERKLHQLSYNHGQVVMQISTVNGSALFKVIGGTSRLWVRAPASVLQQLGAEENLFKEMEITGVLHTTRIVDVTSITVGG